MAWQRMAWPLHCPAGGEGRGNREKLPAVALAEHGWRVKQNNCTLVAPCDGWI